MNVKPKITQSSRNCNKQDVVKDGIANNPNPVDTHTTPTIDYPPLKKPILPEPRVKMMAGYMRFKKPPPRLIRPPLKETLYSPASLPTIFEKYTTGVKKNMILTEETKPEYLQHLLLGGLGECGQMIKLYARLKRPIYIETNGLKIEKADG